MKNQETYSSLNFTATEIIDLSADFGITNLAANIDVGGDGLIDVSFSNDGGTIYSTPIPFVAGRSLETLLQNITHLKLAHTGEDSSYLIHISASQITSRFDLTLGTSPANPVYTQSISHGATRSVIMDATETQLVIGPGILGTIVVGDTQNIDVWDFNGIGPAVSDLIAAFKNVAPGVQEFNLPFQNGLRIAGQMAKTFTVFYEG